MTKNQLQAHIAEYKKRREKFRKQYGKRTPEYVQKIKPYNRKIINWGKQLKTIERREQKIKMVDQMVMDFLDTPSLKGKGWVKIDPQLVPAKKLFYKTGMEMGIPGAQLAKYTGAYRKSPGRARLVFTRSFKTDPNNLKLWHSFKQFKNAA